MDMLEAEKTTRDQTLPHGFKRPFQFNIKISTRLEVRCRIHCPSKPTRPVNPDEELSSGAFSNTASLTPLSLIAIRSASNLEVNNETLQILKEAFKNCESLSPFLVLGHPQSGKSTMLDAILGESAFKGLPDEEGLYVWPHPVPLGSQTLLLMEMSGIIFSSPNDTIMKLAAIAEALSAVCGICLEKASFLENLCTLVHLCGNVDSKSIHCPKKFLVFTSLELPNKSRRNSPFIECPNYLKNCVFMVRDRANSSEELIQSILREMAACSKDFPHTRVLTEGPNTVIGRFAHFAHLATRVANMTSSVLDFIRNFDDLKQLDESHPAQLLKLQEWQRTVVRADSLQLLHSINGAIEVAGSTLTTLKGNFNLEGETVVLAVLGDPGVGKSTLLNCFIQHAASLPSLRSLFPASYSDISAVKKCMVMSCPILMGADRNLQCMLIDLGGLGGVETTRKETLMEQERVVTAVLALASLPCFVITNELSSIAALEKRVKLLSELKQYYDCDVDGVLLLFNDKNITAAPNPHWEAALQQLQQQYFKGRKVFTVLNKPNFVSGDTQQKLQFLDIFLRECAIQRYEQAQGGSLLRLFHRIRDIVHSLEPVNSLILTPEESKEYTSFAMKYFSHIDIFQTIQIQPKKDLYVTFIEKLQELAEDPTILACKVAVRRKMHAEMVRLSSRQRLCIREIDAFYCQTEFMPKIDFLSRMQDFQKQGIASKRSYRLWTLKSDVAKGYDLLLTKISSCYPHLGVQKSRYETMLEEVCSLLEVIKRSSILKSLTDIADNLRAAPYTEVPCASILILVVGDPERILFCNKLVEILQPFTFPGFQTFAEGNQCFTLAYYPSSTPCTCCIVSLKLFRDREFGNSDELLSKAALVFFLLDSPSRAYTLTSLQAAEVMLRSYRPPAAPANGRKVIFLSNDPETLANCQQLPVYSFDVDCRSVTVGENDESMMELLYEVPRLIRGLH